MNNQRVPGFRTFDVERTGKRIISFDEHKGIARLLQRIAETVQRVRVEDIAGLESRNGRSGTEEVFYGVDGSVVLDDFGFGWRRWSLSQTRKRQNQAKNKEMQTHNSPPRIRKGSATHS